MKMVSVKLIILLIISSLIPMLVFGIIAISTSTEANYSAVTEGNLSTARRAAEQIDQYQANSISVLKALSENISKTDLKPWQIERMFKNYLLEFERFKEISLFDLGGRRIATSRFDVLESGGPPDDVRQKVLAGGIYRSEVFISEDLMPVMLLGLPIKRLNEIDGIMIAR
ncbi:MAG: cache domain-containing protein, partial [Nitrospirota bacterium]